MERIISSLDVDNDPINTIDNYIVSAHKFIELALPELISCQPISEEINAINEEYNKFIVAFR